MATPKVIDLGKLVELFPDAGIQPPQTYDAIIAAADAGTLDDKTIVDKALQDNKEMPSVWFVNFPDKPAAAQQEKLRKYMQSIQDYRCWASLIWWRTVYSQPNIAQDGSPEAIAARSAYCAKVAVTHMKKTPWYVIPLNSASENQITEHPQARSEPRSELVQGD